MAIKLATNFALNSRQALDARNQFNTLADLKAVTDAVMDDGHLAYCMENQKFYVYNSGNTVDATVGKWRELQTTMPGKGEAGGVASLGSDGKVPASQLPSYVDDVQMFKGFVDGVTVSAGPAPSSLDSVVFDRKALKFYGEKNNYEVVGGKPAYYESYNVNSDMGVFPTGPTPMGGKIYVDASNPDKSTSYRWSGTGLMAIGGGSLVIGTDTGTAFDGAKGKALEDTVGNLTFTSNDITNVTPKTDSLVLVGKYWNLKKGKITEKNDKYPLTFPAATKDLAGVMTAADKVKLDMIGFVGYSLKINGNSLSLSKTKADLTIEDETVTLPSGDTADGKLSNEEIDDAIVKAFE